MTRIVELRDRGFLASSRFRGHGISLRQSDWRQIRLSESDLRDVEEWVMTIDRNDNACPDWNLTTWHEVGEAPVEVDKDTAETLRSFGVELKGLSEDAAKPAAWSVGNFEELGA